MSSRPHRILDKAGLTADVLAAVHELLVGCGGFVKELLRYTASASTRKDDSGQRLSAADGPVELLLRERLAALVPGSAGYGEEAGHFGERRAGLQVRWQIDPLDGTRPALLGGAYAVSVGALIVEDEHPVAAVGWVYVPNLSSLYRGVIGASSEATLNGEAVSIPEIEAEQLSRRYIAVGSDWQALPLPHCGLKLTAPGASAVHLTQMVHPDSDLAAVYLSRYKGYDIAGGLPVAVAGGCEVFAISVTGEPASRAMDPLQFLAERDADPASMGPRMLVASSAVAAALRG